MSKVRFDECCPHCGGKIKALSDYFSSAVYATQFDFDCPHCSREIECNVVPVPEFELSKKETAAEYAARVAKMREGQHGTDRI